MNVHLLRREQIIPRPPGDVFSFFARPENLAVITPPGLGFNILTPTPVSMHQGTVIDYTILILKMRRHWRTLITDYDPPHHFTDIQLKGPYTFWHHTHSFEAVADGTRIVDEIRYVIPWGVLGDIAQKIVVARQLDAIFAYRADVISRRFGSSPATDQASG